MSTWRKYAKQYIAIADKASKSYVNGEIAKIPHVAAATDVLEIRWK